MGGYAAIRAALALPSHGEMGTTAFAVSALAFGPQVFIDPEERALLGLPATAWETDLRRLKATCALRAVPMASAADDLLDATPPPEGTLPPSALDVAVFVGALAHGDVHEARLLQQAAVSSAGGCGGAASSSADTRVRVHVHVHEGVGHAIVRTLRDSGELDRMLRRAREPPPGSEISVC